MRIRNTKDKRLIQRLFGLNKGLKLTDLIQADHLNTRYSIVRVDVSSNHIHISELLLYR